ncbi:putative short chain dehydrogenase/reductase [Aspergillus fischeri NRRL 181]|uniref:Short chain dehydrogenase/reductase family oxidoreductase, putative n=1 Tax=Neosartorya fischeri (strain ATCC 1020 / DSM 3700 / CBS 544.65 / FGSC A1164 / JCM 1740 / NRRL 181 / WB 181) TaxID=331117 RepID=A1DIL8_NEOFI|nr:short chain dehydrogenase/reductase family oxidoreductase, putative [Aspergillus fischeri NRRL 181]EAW19225.1 short chain dehydrogenase/reductase family oxidoreductase, putative [Aspergillus fischeri NRRL 181]
MAPYIHTGPVDCERDFDPSSVKGKTAIVTGGASGLGEAYVRALVAAGVYVCFGDIDLEKGQRLAAELPMTKFVPCDAGSWDDQVRLFENAVSLSPNGRIAYVVANAGIHRPDEVFEQPHPDQEPAKPDLAIIDINIKGPLYTAKLAAHYFIRQNGSTPTLDQEDTCLIFIGSGAAFLDCPRAPQYSASKWAMRGIMHSLRRTTYYYGSRVNVISPWYVRTNILPEKTFDHVSNVGVQFATTEDAGQCLLRILSDPSVNGHSFFVTARKWASRGYVDLDLDDYPGNALLGEIQEEQMLSAPVSAGLFI